MSQPQRAGAGGAERKGRPDLDGGNALGRSRATTVCREEYRAPGAPPGALGALLGIEEAFRRAESGGEKRAQQRK